MTELFQFALNSIDIGIIIIDSNQNIIFWNNYMEKISQTREREAIGKQLSDVCATFQKKRYQDILELVILHNQSRFCSSMMHKAFVYPANSDTAEIRQNMIIEPVTFNNKTYALIQIDDITDEVSNEHKLTSLINELKKGYFEVKESEEINRQLAELDPLTKIANRHSIDKNIDLLFKKRVDIFNCALMFIDLDGFKSINDTYGHLMGDSLLIEVANILKRIIRKEDLVARLGGDEFLILLSCIEDAKSLESIGKKLVNAISQPIEIDGTTLHVTASIGIAMFDQNLSNARDFVKKADEAMYLAKRQGKNQYVLSNNN